MKLEALIVPMELDPKAYEAGIVSAGQKTQRVTGNIGGLNAGLVNLAAGLSLATQGAQLAGQALGAVMDAAGRAEDIQDADAALLAFAGTSERAALFAEAVKNASNGMLSSFGATTAATRILSLGLAKTAGEAANVAQLAVSLGDAFGKEAGPAVEDFTNMLATGRTLGLKEYGISAAEVTQRAKELKLQTAGLTDAQAKQNAILEIASEKLDQLTASGYEAGDSTAQLRATWEDFTDNLATSAAPALDWVVSGLDSMLTHAQRVQDAIKTLGGREFGGGLVRLAGGDLLTYEEAIERAAVVSEDWHRSINGRLIPAVDDLGDAVEGAGEEFDNATQEAKSFFEGIDRGISSTIEGFIADLNFSLAGGIEYQNIATGIENALSNHQISEEQARQMFENVYIEEQTLEIALGNITAEEAAENISNTLGISLGAAATLVDQVQHGLDLINGSTVSVTIQYNQGGAGTGHNYGALPQNAAGGEVYSGVPSWTGEAGRELFIPEVDGRILSHQDSMAAVSGAGGQQIDYERMAQEIVLALRPSLQAYPTR